MQATDLGPLESAALQAFARAELIDSPLTVAALWRALPGYRTSLANVRAALEEGQPLGHWVQRDKDFFVLAGRDDLLASIAARQGRCDGVWRELAAPLRGLSKVPWVEAVGVTGTMAFGLLDEGAPCEIVVIAEGGRVALARAAVRTWRKAAGKKVLVRIAAVLDGDALALPESGATAAWWLLGVRPVTNEAAFERLWAANPWARSLYPNCDASSTGGVPEYFVGPRIDGRLAALRRAAVATEDDGVLLGSAGRRTPAWEAALSSLVASRPVAAPCREWVGADGVDVLAAADLSDGDARVQRRCAELAALVDPSDAGEPSADEPEEEPEEGLEEEGEEPKPAPVSTRARAKRTRPRPEPRPKRPRSAAAPEG